MNRIDQSIMPVLEEFCVKNQFVTVLSMRGMGMLAMCLNGLLQRFSDGYYKKKAEME